MSVWNLKRYSLETTVIHNLSVCSNENTVILAYYFSTSRSVKRKDDFEFWLLYWLHHHTAYFYVIDNFCNNKFIQND